MSDSKSQSHIKLCIIYIEMYTDSNSMFLILLSNLTDINVLHHVLGEDLGTTQCISIASQIIAIKFHISESYANQRVNIFSPAFRLQSSHALTAGIPSDSSVTFLHTPSGISLLFHTPLCSCLFFLYYFSRKFRWSTYRTTPVQMVGIF